VALFLIYTHTISHIAVHYDCRRIHVYAADYYCGNDHPNRDFQLQND
jgi:hypothetical protein